MYDAIVIGSGIGGLATAGLLAGVAGKRVLVLEKHTQPGGLTHSFRRDGASWDIGLHYVGELAPGSMIRQFFDYLSGQELDWNPMPDPVEKFVYPGLVFDVPADPERYRQRLIEAFPDEAQAVNRYFSDVARATRWNQLNLARQMMPGFLSPAVRLAQVRARKLATQTTKDYLDHHIRSPKLRALLASQWGDYGLPPSRSAFAVHSQIISHYLNGAWFPAGGSSRIARTFERGIEQAGGAVRVASEVTRIVVEDGRAVGVEVRDHRHPTPQTSIHRAPAIVSGVGADLTFNRLLPPDPATQQASAGFRALLDELGTGTSAVTLYLRLKEAVKTIGVHGENYWVNASWDHESDDTANLLAGRPQRCYVSFPSAKSGEDQHHTAEIIAFTEADAFRQWQDRPQGNRGADYSALKRTISEGLLGLAETAIPGLTDLVSYAELSTPLSVEHFSGHPAGAFYGLPATPARVMASHLGPRTPIPGLYLTGQDAGCSGIVGAMMSGMGTACQILGPRGFPLIQRAIKKPRTTQVTATPGPLPEGKYRARLRTTRRLTSKIWLAEFEMESCPDWAAGQYARLQVADYEWRDYSIVAMTGSTVTFLISTHTGGYGSRFIATSPPGTQTVIELPLGQMRLLPGKNRSLFVATGTGLAPFMAMFAELADQSRMDSATLLFGCRTEDENVLPHLSSPLPGTVITCLSREVDAAGNPPRRVTTVLDQMEIKPGSVDVYICGNPAMVAEATSQMMQKGITRLVTETF